MLFAERIQVEILARNSGKVVVLDDDATKGKETGEHMSQMRQPTRRE